MADSTIPEYKPPKADAVPKGRTPKAAKPKRTPPKPTMPIDEIREELTELFIGMGLIALSRNEVDGIILIGGSPDTIDAWCGLAEKNPYVHMFLQKACATSDLTKVLSTTIPMALALANNHGMNVPTPRPFGYYKKRAEQVIEEQELDEESENDGSSSNGTAATGATVS